MKFLFVVPKLEPFSVVPYIWIFNLMSNTNAQTSKIVLTKSLPSTTPPTCFALPINAVKWHHNHGQKVCHSPHYGRHTCREETLSSRNTLPSQTVELCSCCCSGDQFEELVCGPPSRWCFKSWSRLLRGLNFEVPGVSSKDRPLDMAEQWRLLVLLGLIPYREKVNCKWWWSHMMVDRALLMEVKLMVQRM